MLHKVALCTLLCTVGMMTGWGVSRRFLGVRHSRMSGVSDTSGQAGKSAPSGSQRWAGWSLLSPGSWKTEPLNVVQTHSDRSWLDWFGWIFPKEGVQEGVDIKSSVIEGWGTSFLPRGDALWGNAVPCWCKNWLRGDWEARILYCYLERFKHAVIWIGNMSFRVIQPIRHAVDGMSLSNGLLVMLSTLPYVFLSVIKLWPWTGPCKQLGKGRDRKVSMATTCKASPNSMSAAKAIEIITRFQGLQLANSNAEKDVIRKAEELELMSKLVEFLRGKCQHQSKELQRKITELEEMARAVEHLQRPSSKRWSDLLDRVYKNTYPAVIKTEYYKLHVPLDGADKDDKSVAQPHVLEKDDSETEVTPGTELDWDECG